jgi:peptidoglycan/LPS O-acetylase OafA/YrhL
MDAQAETLVAEPNRLGLPMNLNLGLSQAELPGLNGIRAIAAFLVVFYHFGLPGVSGGLGVLIFFVLSGFLITWLLLAEQERTSTISLRKFYARRTLRIFPAFYAYWFLLITALLVSHKTIHWAQALCSFFYVNNYYQGIFGDPNTGLSHTWSLAVEEQFYLLWPVTFLALSRDRRRMAYTLVGMIGALWLYRFVMRFGFHVWQGYAYEAFDMRADHLLIGCLLAVSLRSGMFVRLWEFLCSHWLPGALTVLGLALCSYVEQRSPVSFRDAFSFTVAPLLSAFLIVSAIAFSGRGFWRALDWNWMRYLGRISYSIYLYQQLTVGIANKFTAHYPLLVRLAAAVALTILAATGSYFIVERYFLSLKARFANSPAAGQEPKA